MRSDSIRNAMICRETHGTARRIRFEGEHDNRGGNARHGRTAGWRKLEDRITRSTAVNEADDRAPWRSGTFHVILAISLMGVMGVSLISPVLPGLREAFAISDAQVGLVITAYTLPGVFLAPFAGLVADRLGRRRVIIPLLFIFGIAGGAIAVVDSFRMVLGLRFIQGIGASALVTLGVTLIGDHYDGQQRAAAMGANGSVLASGAAFYPLLGGGLGAIGWNIPFAFYGIAVIIGIAAVFVLEEPDPEMSRAFLTYLKEIRMVLLSPAILAVNGAILLVFLLFYGAIQTALPLLLSDDFGIASNWIGGLLSLVAVASAAISFMYGRFSRARSLPRLITIGFACYGFGLIIIAIAGSLPVMAAALLLFGAGFGFMMPSVDLAIAEISPDDLRAGTMGVRTSMLRIGQTIGPVLFTVTAQAVFPTTVFGYRTLVLVSGIICVGAGLVTYVVVEQ